LWVAQAAVFWRGMNAIRRFIDWAGPAVYVVMVALCVYLVVKAGGLSHISLNLSSHKLSLAASIPVMITAVAIVVSYFSGPMLNFGDFSRYGKSFKSVRTGNWLGLPVNFLFFSLLTVITASATVPVFGELITDPIITVERVDNAFAILLGGLTFVIATVGINIVANFISPAFDFSNVNPKKISWRMGGMIAAVGSVLLTPWNWYNSSEGILYTLGILGGLIGPLFGVLIAGYYLVSKQQVWVDDMFVMTPKARYWFRNGYNPNAVAATIIGGLPAIAMVLVAGIMFGDSENMLLSHLGDFSWFVGCGLGLVAFWQLERFRPMINRLDEETELATDGTSL
jgi:NCS1 family nucleobase:cation symporter-1